MYFFDADGHVGWAAASWLFAALVVAWIFHCFVRYVGRRDRARDSPNSPKALLKGRYAKGEIDRPTYLRMRGELGGQKTSKTSPRRDGDSRG